MQVNSEDTNGVLDTLRTPNKRMPVKWFWDDLAGWKDSTATDSIRYQFRLVDIDRATPWAIRAKDDDGLVRGDTFQVYADGPPPAPNLLAPGADTAYFTNVPVVLRWAGFDKHDSLATEYAVLVNPPGAATPEDTVQTFKSATQYAMEGNVMTYTYMPGLAGVYSWRIAVKDMQKTVTSSAVRQFSHPGP